jgi:hypothetical protein
MRWSALNCHRLPQAMAINELVSVLFQFGPAAADLDVLAVYEGACA